MGIRSKQQEDTIDLISMESLGAHMIFEEINELSAKDTCEFILKANVIDKESPITLFINTPGGSVTDGFAIIDVMSCVQVPIQTVGLGLIASMGVLIFCAGNKGARLMTKNTEIMAHQFYAEFGGKQHEINALSKSFKRTEQKILKHFLEHSAMTESQIKDILFGPSDRYLTAKECKKYGLCDQIISSL